ncbi:MAG: hypothetical protein U0234_21510 [Sandaracinus sp.]
MVWGIGGLALVAGIGLFLYRRWRATQDALRLTLVAVMMSFPDGKWERIDDSRGRVRRGQHTIDVDLFPAMDALGNGGLPGLLVHLGTSLFLGTTAAYRTEIEVFFLERLRTRFPDAEITGDDGRALTVRAAGSVFELVRLPMLLELWGRDDEPLAERLALVDKILDARVRSNDAASHRERVLPRFTTPDREARMLGTIETQRKVKGLKYPVDCVLDAGNTCLTIGAAAFSELGVKSHKQLHALALENLRKRMQPFRYADAGLHVVSDRADHAAAQVLLIPEKLVGDQAMFAVAPAPGGLVFWRADDHDAAREARKKVKSASPDVAPIPKPVRITHEGFARSSWAEALGTAAAATPPDTEEASAE